LCSAHTFVAGSEIEEGTLAFGSWGFALYVSGRRLNYVKVLERGYETAQKQKRLIPFQGRGAKKTRWPQS